MQSRGDTVTDPQTPGAKPRLIYAAAEEPRLRRWGGVIEVVDGPTARAVLGDPTVPTWEAMKGEPH